MYIKLMIEKENKFITFKFVFNLILFIKYINCMKFVYSIILLVVNVLEKSY